MEKAKKSTWLLASLIIPALLTLFILVLNNAGALSDELFLVNNSRAINGQLQTLQQYNTDAGYAFTKFLDTKDLRSRIHLTRLHGKIKNQKLQIRKRKQYIVVPDEYSVLEILLAKMTEIENTSLVNAAGTDSSDIGALAEDLHVSIHASLDTLLKQQDSLLQQQLQRTDALRTQIIFISCGMAVVIVLLAYLLWRRIKTTKKTMLQQKADALTTEETDLLVASESYREIDEILSSGSLNPEDKYEPIENNNIVINLTTNAATDLSNDNAEPEPVVSEHIPTPDPAANYDVEANTDAQTQNGSNETYSQARSNIAEERPQTNIEETPNPNNVLPADEERQDNFTAATHEDASIHTNETKGLQKDLSTPKEAEAQPVIVEEQSNIAENAAEEQIIPVAIATEMPADALQPQGAVAMYSMQDLTVKDSGATIAALEHFLKDAPICFRSMQLCVATGNMLELFKTIQKFKGSLSTFYMYPLLECVNNLEGEAAVLKRTYTLNGYITAAMEVFDNMKPLLEAEIALLQNK